jgi:uncharacterized protein YaaN involved in tellurite resistance
MKEQLTKLIEDLKKEMVGYQAKAQKMGQKIDEIINMITVPSKTHKIKDNNIVDLLQYYDLVKELEHANR